MAPGKEVTRFFTKPLNFDMPPSNVDSDQS